MRTLHSLCVELFIEAVSGRTLSYVNIYHGAGCGFYVFGVVVFKGDWLNEFDVWLAKV